MSKKSTVTEPIVEEITAEEVLPVDVTFSDEHIALMGAASLEPAQVRNEIGLSKVKDGKLISFTEALNRAVAKYHPVVTE